MNNGKWSQVKIYAPVLLVLGFIFILQWSGLFNPAQAAWDGAFYYAFARSIVFDLDLDLVNDLILSYPTAQPAMAAKQFETILTETGRVHSPFAIGSALLWVPWLGVLRILDEIYRWLGFTGNVATGYEWVFITGIASFSTLCGFWAFWFSYKLASRVTEMQSALLATITLMFTTPLLYYQFREPFYSHTSSALMTTLCIYVWWKGYRKVGTFYEGVLLGGAIGLAVLVRWQHLVYVGLPVLSTVWLGLSSSQENRYGTWKAIFLYLIGVLSTVFAFLTIQFSIWHLFYGSWLTVPQGEAYVDWSAPFLIPVIFSTYRGLIPWFPVIIFAVLGLILSTKREPRLFLPLLLILLFETYINSSTRDWFGGGGYGPRRYTSELTIFILGYSRFLCHLSGLIEYVLPKTIANFAKIGVKGNAAFWRNIPGVGICIILVSHQWILLRYGLVEKIGGFHTSMYPSYQWTDVSYIAFIQQILGHISDPFHSPGEFFIFPNSPLHLLLYTKILPMPLILAGFATIAFMLLCYAIWFSVYRAATKFPVVWCILMFTLIGIIDLWIIVWA